MKPSRAAPVPASAVALAADSLPTMRQVGAVLRASWPDVRVGARRQREHSPAERSLMFLCGPDRVGAARFPFPLEVTGVSFPAHSSHVWLSVRGYDRERRNDALRLLARATAAITKAGDAAFVWWSVGDRVIEPAVFLASAGQQA